MEGGREHNTGGDRHPPPRTVGARLPVRLLSVCSVWWAESTVPLAKVVLAMAKVGGQVAILFISSLLPGNTRLQK